jgi:hypothetical protein
MWHELFGKRVMFLMAPEGGSGGAGGGDAGDGGAGADDSKKPADADGSGKKPDKGDIDEDDPRVQEKLNKLLPDRAKQYLRTDVLGPLGFKDEKELKAALTDLKKRQDAEKTDLEKKDQTITELQDAVSQRDKKLKDITIERSVEKAARALKFRDPEDAIVHLRRELDEAEVAEDGSIKGVEDLLKKLAKAKPYLIDDGKGSNAPDIDAKTDTKKKAEQDEKALRGRFGL